MAALGAEAELRLLQLPIAACDPKRNLVWYSFKRRQMTRSGHEPIVREWQMCTNGTIVAGLFSKNTNFLWTVNERI